MARPRLPPADAPVVASLPSATLVAFDHGADLCFGLRGEGPATCGSVPEGILDPDVESESVEGAQVVYGATSSDAVSIEVIANGARVTGSVIAGAYAGQFAGRARFFFVAISGRPYRVLLRDAQGRVVAATDVSSAPAIGRAVDVRHGHIASRAWRAAAYQITRLMPTRSIAGTRSD
jgi:hypothetical protein